MVFKGVHWINSSKADEARRKISLSNMGKPKKKGHKQTKEHIKNRIMARHKNYPDWVTEESRLNFRKARLKQRMITKFTSIELKMKKLLDSLGIEYEMQKPLLGITIVDFFIQPNKCVYCDGTYWHQRPERIIKDKIINEKLKKNGFQVIRLSQENIENDINKCQQEVMC